MSISGQSTLDILKHEQIALSKIHKYMMQNLDSWCQASTTENLKSTISKQAEWNRKFWSYVLQSFSQYFKGIDDFYEGIFIRSLKKRVQYSKENSGELKTKVIFSSPIDALKEAFREVDETYLKHTVYRRDCHELYSELMSKIHAAAIQKAGKNNGVLGKIHFNRINEMLDLQDENIVKLLPFLLTAYVYNFRRNVFMQRRPPTEDIPESIYDTNKGEIKDRRKALEHLSNNFGFNKLNKPDKGIRFKNTEIEISKRNSLPYAFYPSKFPSLDDRSILDLVFTVWLVITSGVGEFEPAIPSYISKVVDVELCYKLYIYYTDRELYDGYIQGKFPAAPYLLQYFKDMYDQNYFDGWHKPSLLKKLSQN